MSVTEANEYSLLTDDGQIALTVEEANVVLADDDDTLLTVAESPVLLTDSGDVALTVEQTTILVTDATSGPQGAPGVQDVWVQDTQPSGPTVASSYIWIQTGLGAGGNDWTLWFEDGS